MQKSLRRFLETGRGGKERLKKDTRKIGRMINMFLILIMVMVS